MFDLLHPALGQTLDMVGVATLFATVLGIPLGVLLHVTAPGGLRPVPVLHRILGTVVDLGRSSPFIVLLQQVVTRPLIGTSIGGDRAAGQRGGAVPRPALRMPTVR